MNDDLIYKLAELSEKISAKFGDVMMCAICGTQSIDKIKSLLA